MNQPILIGKFNDIRVWDSRHTTSLDGVVIGDILVRENYDGRKYATRLMVSGLWGIDNSPLPAAAFAEAVQILNGDGCAAEFDDELERQRAHVADTYCPVFRGEL